MYMTKMKKPKGAKERITRRENRVELMRCLAVPKICNRTNKVKFIKNQRMKKKEG